MDQQQLSDRLEDRVADLAVGAPPLDAMRSSARRRRRGRTAVVASVIAVAVITGGLAVQSIDTSPDPQPSVAADLPSEVDVPPAGHRYVGIGAAVIAVPDEWGTNETECGTPQQDTVVIDQGFICMALVPRPEGVESVAVSSSPMPETEDVWTPIEIDGEPALQSPVMTTSGNAGFEGTVSSVSVYLPERKVLFVAESSSPSPEALVTGLVAGIAILEEHTTVPVFNDLAYDMDAATAIESYVARLEELGLAVEVVEKGSPLNSGDVLETDPAVGSVVAPGDTVRVTVAR